MTRLIDADALAYEILSKYGTDGGTEDVNTIYEMIINAPTGDIAFLCDGTACKEECHKQCFHTTDIRHARNFYKEGEAWVEMLEV